MPVAEILTCELGPALIGLYGSFSTRSSLHIGTGAGLRQVTLVQGHTISSARSLFFLQMTGDLVKPTGLMTDGKHQIPFLLIRRWPAAKYREHSEAVRYHISPQLTQFNQNLMVAPLPPFLIKQTDNLYGIYSLSNVVFIQPESWTYTGLWSIDLMAVCEAY
jgi:hypothetical protein